MKEKDSDTQTWICTSAALLCPFLARPLAHQSDVGRVVGPLAARKDGPQFSAQSFAKNVHTMQAFDSSSSDKQNTAVTILVPLVQLAG